VSVNALLVRFFPLHHRICFRTHPVVSRTRVGATSCRGRTLFASARSRPHSRQIPVDENAVGRDAASRLRARFGKPELNNAVLG
jgi:hypothetical protein